MQKTTTTCDNCDADLSESGPRTQFFLTLSCGRVPSTSKMQYLVHVFPPISDTMHFCGLGCLTQKFAPKE